MPFRLQAKLRKSKKGGSQSDSLIYGLLCLGVIGFFAWVWWHSTPEQKNAPDKTPATRKTNTHGDTPPLLLERKQYRAITNALDEFAQVAKKLKNGATQATPNLAISSKTPTLQSAPPAAPKPRSSDRGIEPLVIPVASNRPISRESALTSLQPSVNGTNVVKTNAQRIGKVPESAASKDTPVAASPGSRPVETMLEAQIALARLGIFPGSIDGRLGSQTRSALSTFQRKQHLKPTGTLDAETKAQLLVTSPSTAPYTVTPEDIGRLLPVGVTWLEKSEQNRLDFETVLELISEKAHSHPRLIRDLNPGVNWEQITAGTRIIMPQVSYPAVTKAAVVKISLQGRVLEAFDSATNLLVHFPCSIGRLAEKRPVGELHVEAIAPNPNYTFDPAVFPESPEAQTVGRKLILPPGPNNPVGDAWIGLNLPGYGIHGTPSPEQVGRTESHGCFRLANWNAEYLCRLVWIGMPIIVEP